MPVRAPSPRAATPAPFTSATPHLVSCQLKMPGHTPQASTAPLQNLSSKLVKARHCLHAVNLQVETIRNECDKARREVEASDTEISGMEHEEERLKLQYVESAPAGHKRTSCYSRRAARMEASSPLSPQHGGRAVSRWVSLTKRAGSPGLQASKRPLTFNQLTHLHVHVQAS